MSLLALAAMLMLLLVPTVGRLLAGASGSSDGTWAQMCTMAGLKLVKLTPGNANPAGPDALAPKSGGGGDMPGDCAYCPLLGTMVALLVWLVFAFPQLAAHVLPALPALLPRTRWHPCGLGSRGPPVAL